MLSSIACGELVGVDTSAALKVPGVVAYIDSRDVHDGFLIEGDTPVFVERKVASFLYTNSTRKISVIFMPNI